MCYFADKDKRTYQDIEDNASAFIYRVSRRYIADIPIRHTDAIGVGPYFLIASSYAIGEYMRLKNI